MTTLNLGKLVYLWRGDYDPAQTHAAYDVCRHAGNVYICVENAHPGEDPTSTQSHWRIMLEGPGSPLTTAGNLLCHDGTRATRLAAGKDGQTLVIRQGKPAWGETGGTLIRVSTFTDATRAILSNSGRRTVMFRGHFIKEKTTSTILVTGTVPLGGRAGSYPHFGEAFMAFATGTDRPAPDIHGQIHNTRAARINMGANYIVDLAVSGMAKGRITWEMGYHTAQAIGLLHPAPVVNPNEIDNYRSRQTQTRLTFREVETLNT